MSDPEETPAQALERLSREIAQLRRLRAAMPMMILAPYVEAASNHIREVAARLSVQAKVPAVTAIEISREEQQAATQPTPLPEIPPELPAPGTRVVYQPTGPPGFAAMALYHVPVTPPRSPPEYEVVILTEDGRILTVKPSELATGIPTVMPTPKLSPGQRVRDKATEKTGFISEIAEDKAMVALDEGGFVTRALTDLEPL